MAFTSRRLLPSYSDSYSSSPSQSPSPSPSPSPLPSDDFYCPSYSNCYSIYSSPPPPPPPYLLPPPPPYLLPPPSPSLLPPPHNPSPALSGLISTPGIIGISLLSSLFLLLVYFILLARSRRNRPRPNNRGLRQGPPPPPGDGGQREEEEEWNQNQAMVHPIWLINTVGLQPAMISSIAVCEFKKGEGLIEGDYCSICLSDFEEGESLRLLPKCSHAFHIPCIDTWLRSHTNCPLCRAPILAPEFASSSLAVLEPAGSGSGSRSRSGGGGDAGGNNEGGGNTGGDNTGDSRAVVEGDNDEEGSNDKSGAEEVEVGASVGRRSVSMDGIASTITNVDGEGNPSSRVVGVRSLPGSRRFCRPGSD